MAATKKTVKKNESDMSVINIDPCSYWKEVYRNTGNYIQEDKFDSSIGVKWLGDYKFSIIDHRKWNNAKEDFLLK